MICVASVAWADVRAEAVAKARWSIPMSVNSRFMKTLAGGD